MIPFLVALLDLTSKKYSDPPNHGIFVSGAPDSSSTTQYMPTNWPPSTSHTKFSPLPEEEKLVFNGRAAKKKSHAMNERGARLSCWLTGWIGALVAHSSLLSSFPPYWCGWDGNLSLFAHSIGKQAPEERTGFDSACQKVEKAELPQVQSFRWMKVLPSPLTVSEQ